MAESIQAHMEELRASIEGLEAQRGLLGKKIINPAIETLSQKLAQLNQQADSSQEGHQGQAGLPAEDRRMGTVLFTDMVGSTGIGEKLDLNEAWHLLKMTYFGTMIRPGWTYQTYAEILESLDKEENARAVVEAVHAKFLDVAQTFSVPEWRQSFLENVPDNRAQMEMWERGKV